MARSTKTAPTKLTPENTDIARRAFELYCARGCEDGHHIQDWLQAERELREATAAPEVRPQRAPKPRRSEPLAIAIGESAAASAMIDLGRPA
jgi:hypothetical protein